MRTEVDRGIVDRGFVDRGIVDLGGVTAGAVVSASVGECSVPIDGVTGVFGGVERGVFVPGVASCAEVAFAARGFATLGFAAFVRGGPAGRGAAGVHGAACFRARGEAAAGVAGVSESSPEVGAADAPAGFSSGSESTCQPYQRRLGCLCENWASHHEMGTRFDQPCAKLAHKGKVVTHKDVSRQQSGDK